jgi:hypothetical protein
MNNTKLNQTTRQPEQQIRPPGEEKHADPFLVLNDEQRIFLNLNRLPAALTEAQTAALLGFKRHQIPLLAALGFLRPLGNPAPNGEKLYARVQVLKHGENAEWLSRAKAAVSQHWRMKNARKTKNQVQSDAQMNRN